MTPELKKALGRVIKGYREKFNWTQEHLAGTTGINLRTVQRAESGQGISKENLGAIATAFDLDQQKLLKEARNKRSAPPEKRFSLRQLTSGAELVEILNQARQGQSSLEIGLKDEHAFNEFIGEDINWLSEQLENPERDKNALAESDYSAEQIVRMCAKMGFRLFAGSYFETIKSAKGTRKNATIQIIAVANSDPRIKKTANGLALDLVRDSRRLLHGQFMGGLTCYDSLEHQLLAKSNGEERVKDTLRRLLWEVAQEIETSRKRKRKRTK
jgi:transcriptional regulator with XRE-family HTH domain